MEEKYADEDIMNVVNIPTSVLFVSKLNARKDLTNYDAESSTINDLSRDIKQNGLLNPLTVRRTDDGKFEIIAGQRRFLAMKLINKETIPCHVINVNDQKAEELSLTENIQRSQLSTSDNVRLYGKLHDFYKSISKVVEVVNISYPTVKKYLDIRNLPYEILRRLDVKGRDRLTIETAVALSKLPNEINKLDFLNAIDELSSQDRVKIIKQFIEEDHKKIKDLPEMIKSLANNVVNKTNAIGPYIFDRSVGRNVKISDDLFDDIMKLIKKKKQVIEYYL